MTFCVWQSMLVIASTIAVVTLLVTAKLLSRQEHGLRDDSSREHIPLHVHRWPDRK